MGNLFSKNQSNANRVSSIHEPSYYSEFSGTTEDINIPDNTTGGKGKSKSVSIFSKTRSFIGYNKGVSLQSAVVSNTKSEIDRLRIENDEMRQEYDEIINMLRKEKQELLEELTPMKNSVKYLNTMVSKLKAELKKLTVQETDALERANIFENERDKIQRNFKLVRETNEKQVQVFIKEKQQLIEQLRKYMPSDGSIKDYLMESGELRQGSHSVTDWLWDNPSIAGESYFGRKRESESEKGSTFIDLKASKDSMQLLKKLLSPLLQLRYGVPESNVYTIFLTSTKSMFATSQKFIRSCRKLMLQLEMDGRLSSIMYFPIETESAASVEKKVCFDHCLAQCDIFIALLNSQDSNESIVKIYEMIESSSKICILGTLGKLPQEDTDQLMDSLSMHEKLSICPPAPLEEELIESCVTKTSDLTKFFWKKQIEVEEMLTDPLKDSLASNELFLQSFDILGNNEQSIIMQLQSNHGSQDTLINIAADIIKLNEYMIKEGPSQPFFFFSNPGIGKSYILSQWILYLQQNLVDTCILYHFVSPGSENSMDPVLMMKRFASKLLDQFSKTFDMHQVNKDFPIWLERACNKYVNGVIIIIDNADLLKNHKDHLKFLLDPLPVPVRVIISASTSNYPKQWEYWPTMTATVPSFDDTLNAFTLNLENYIENVDSILNDLMQEAYTKQKTLLQNNITNHLHRYLTCTYVKEMSTPERYVDDLYQCLHVENLMKLYMYIISKLQLKYGTSLVSELLILLYTSRNGLTFMDMFDLSSESTSSNICAILKIFEKFKMTWELCGLVQIQKLQVREAIIEIFHLRTENELSINLRERIIQLSMKKLKARYVSYRVADELPWQLMNIDKKDALKECLENFAIFIQLHNNGKIHILLEYWKFLNRDINTIYTIYMNLLSKMENETVFDKTIPMLYDLFGELLQDLGQYKLANQAFDKSLELKEAHYDSDDQRIGNSFIRLGKLFTHWKKYQTAENYYKQALEIKEQNNDNNNISYVQLIEALAVIYIFQDKTKDAELYKKQSALLRQKILKQVLDKNFDTAIKDCIDIIDDFRERQLYQENLGDYLTEIAAVYCNMQRTDETVNMLTQAIEYYAVVHGNGHTLVGETMCKLSYVYQLKKEDDKAEELLNEALSLFLQNHEKNVDQINNTVQSFVKLLRKQTRIDDIEKLYRRLIEEYKSCGDSDASSTLLAKSSNYLGVFLCNMGRFQEALELYRDALIIYEKQYGFQHDLVTEVLSNFAKLHYDLRDLSMAAYLYQLSENPDRTFDQLINHQPSALSSSPQQYSSYANGLPHLSTPSRYADTPTSYPKTPSTTFSILS